MARRPNGKSKQSVPNRGNFISEWYCHRVYPKVAIGSEPLSDQVTERCPFISDATGQEKKCVKSQNSIGVCCISSASNGLRQDWLVCPYRALGSRLMEDSTRRMFEFGDRRIPLVRAAPLMADERERDKFKKHVRSGERGFLFVQTKLGGEISLSATDKSPEVSFDSTVVEIVYDNGFKVGCYGIFEVQTMDFHGTYRKAVKNLQDALRLHKNQFSEVVTSNSSWLSEEIEGPNIANVFKRTFYQMMLKFQIAGHASCKGCTIAVPRSVWDSWQKHLGRPSLIPIKDNFFFLPQPGSSQIPKRIHNWIYVFEIESDSKISPAPLRTDLIIGTTPDALSDCALKVAPLAAIEAGGAIDRLIDAVRVRIAQWMPELNG